MARGLEALRRLIDQGCPRDYVTGHFAPLLNQAFTDCQACYDREDAAEAEVDNRRANIVQERFKIRTAARASDHGALRLTLPAIEQ